VAGLRYSWKRFWYPQNGRVAIDDNGFLEDPESQFAELTANEAVSFEEINSIPCLILLGDPGLGKSYALEDVSAALHAQGKHVLFLNLKSYGDEGRLIHEVFESDEIQSWQENRQDLFIFLDSLDECKLQIPHVQKVLAEQCVKRFRGKDLAGLHMRLVCRTADWPQSLMDELQGIWGKEKVATYQLAPLRQSDVAQAAQAHGIDPDAFRKAVLRNSVGPLAARPATLEFLLEEFTSDKGLSKSQTALYESGCLKLATELAATRTESNQAGKLSPRQRLIVAARIAAMCTFCKRYALSLSYDSVPNALSFSDIVGMNETTENSSFNITHESARESVGTALFTGQGDHMLGFAHQTYREFLAAWYLKKRGVSPDRILRLLCPAGAPQRQIVPELREVAAWIAGMVPEVFHHLIEHDLEALLHSDTAQVGEHERKDLVSSLLLAADEKRLIDDPYARNHYQRLDHKDLAQQLLPWILGKDRFVISRRIAIDIAEACNKKSLQNELLTTALDLEEDHPIRIQAACAVARIGDERAKAALKPLALGTSGPDPNDELKGIGLQATWPEHISTDELFASLTRLKDEHLVGLYRMFLSHDVVPRLPASGLPTALRWVEWVSARDCSCHELQELAEDILLKAWDNVDHPDVLPALVDAMARRASSRGTFFTRHDRDTDFQHKASAATEKRRKFLRHCLIAASPHDDGLFCCLPPLLSPDDLQWITSEYESEQNGHVRETMARLLFWAFNEENTTLVTWIADRIHIDPILEQVFGPRFSPVELGSKSARQIRKAYERTTRARADRQEEPCDNPVPSTADIEPHALLWGQGDLNGWRSLHSLMSAKSQTGPLGIGPLSNFPHWKSLEIPAQLAVITAAKSYVEKTNPGSETRLQNEEPIPYDVALMGFDALALLWREKPEMLHDLSLDTWARWAPVTLRFHSFAGYHEESEFLIALAYEKAPESVINALSALCDAGEPHYFEYGPLRYLAKAWDARLSSALLAMASRDACSPEILFCLLRELLLHDVPDSQVLAVSLADLPMHDESQRTRAVVAGAALLRFAADAGWTACSRLLNGDEATARQFIQWLAGTWSNRQENESLIRADLSEAHVADLYIQCGRLFPYRPPRTGGHFVSPEDTIEEFKRAILRNLEQRGTEEAIRQLKRISDTFPEMDWLFLSVLSAQKASATRNWLALEPGDFLTFVHEHNKGLVRNADELLEAVIASLQDLEAHLHGSTDAVQRLWNEFLENGKPVSHPKEEQALSGYVKDHLEHVLATRGVIAAREVQVRSRGKTDVYVSAAVKAPGEDEYSNVTVVIEVKGCWNKCLWVAMKSQLVQKYLDQKSRRHGLYLVGWYDSNSWADSSPKRAAALRLMKGFSVAQAQEEFDKQAAELCNDTLVLRALVLDLHWNPSSEKQARLRRPRQAKSRAKRPAPPPIEQD
jgi:hypothetical protein